MTDLAFLLSFRETTLNKEGIRGSKLEVTLEYTNLKPYEVSSRTDEQDFLEKYEKPREESPGKLVRVWQSGLRIVSDTEKAHFADISI